MINKTVNKFIALLAFIFSALFLSYRKGKKDSESEQIKNLVKDYETRKKADEKYNDRIVTDADRKRMQDDWSK